MRMVEKCDVESVRKGRRNAALKCQSAEEPADNNTLARFDDLDNQTTEIGVVKDTLPTHCQQITLRADKVCQSIYLSAILKEHRGLKVVVIHPLKLCAEFAILCTVKFKSADQIACLIVGGDLHRID